MEKIIRTSGGHLFEYVGMIGLFKCKNCGLEVPPGDLRIFGILRYEGYERKVGTDNIPRVEKWYSGKLRR